MILVAGLALLCVAWLLPDHFLPWTAFQQEWLAALGAALIGAAALSPAEPGSVRWPPLAWLVLACAGVPLAQYAVGQIHFFSDALLPMLYLTAFALSMVAGATLAAGRRQELLDGLSVAFVVAGFVSTGMALVQWLQLGPLPYISDVAPGVRPHANFGQPNNLATLLGLGVIALVRGYESRRIGGAVTVVGVGWLGFGLIMTQSRVAWLLVAVMVLGSITLRRRALLRLPPRAVILGALAFVAGVVMWGPLNDVLGVSMSSGIVERVREGTRTGIWLSLWDALWRSPWTGYGWSQVVLAQQAVALDHPLRISVLYNSHNLVLDLLLWNGLPLGLLLTGALAWWFWRQLRLCRDADRWTLLAGVSAVFLHALVEFPLDYAFFLLPVGLMMGALDGTDGSATLLRTPMLALALPLALMTVMLGWIGAEYMRVEDAARQLRLLLVGVGVNRVPTVSPPSVELLDAPREFHRLWLTPARPGMSAAELDWMRGVVRRYPVPPGQLRHALAAGLNGRRQEATETLALLCAMQLPHRCAEARESWAQLRRQYPQLNGIEMPDKGSPARHKGR